MEITSLAESLSISDTPPTPQPRGPKKVKGPKLSSPRLPYKSYKSLDKTIILVGRTASDNDLLSTSEEYGENSDIWMHASGCAGSHVVIKSSDPDTDTVLDAAVLAARESKDGGAGKNVIKVTVTKWGNVVKPIGSKAGLVVIKGDVKTVRVDMKKEKGRLERLDMSEDTRAE